MIRNKWKPLFIVVSALTIFCYLVWEKVAQLFFPDRSSLLKKAIDQRNSDILEQVLQSDANATQQSYQLEYPALLLEVVTRFWIEGARLLLNHNANVNYQRPNDGCTPLLKAAENGQRDMVTLLLDNRANIDQVDRRSWTPLHCAASKANNAAVETLVSRRADVSLRNPEGQTAGDLAKARQQEVQRVLESQQQYAQTLSPVPKDIGRLPVPHVYVHTKISDLTEENKRLNAVLNILR